jgi:hypothetical protein
LYNAIDPKENWVVVDGLQRLTTIHDFWHNKFKLAGLEYLAQINGCDFAHLPRNMQRRIEETELIINIIQPGTPEEVMFNIFSRINTGGLTLNGQEIRHALNKGPVRNFLKDIAEGKPFLRATDKSVSDNRMAARECVLRFFAFWMNAWSRYDTNDLDGYLNAAMQKLNEVSEEERIQYRRTLEQSLNVAYDIFGNDAFRKRYSRSAGRNPVSKPLFEAWTVNLAKRAPSEIKILIERREEVRDRFVLLMVDDRDFEVAVSYGTGVPRRVRKRFSAIEQLIDEVVS